MVLASLGAVVGVWATAAPASFYASFPGAGLAWVALDGPYNEHLIRDVGALHLALTVVSAAAARAPTVARIRTTALSWLAFAVPHAVYHLTHLSDVATADAFGIGASTLVTVVLPLATLISVTRSDRP